MARNYPQYRLNATDVTTHYKGVAIRHSKSGSYASWPKTPTGWRMMSARNLDEAKRQIDRDYDPDWQAPDWDLGFIDPIFAKR